jgi:hypothetical protein
VESPHGRKPLGTRRKKSDFRSSFCRFATPRLVPADLKPGADPERSEGARPNNKSIIFNTFSIFVPKLAFFYYFCLFVLCPFKKYN